MLIQEQFNKLNLSILLETNSTLYWILEKSKETILEFYKETVKVYEIIFVTYK